MKIEINLDLEQAIASALTPERLAPILDKHVVDAITSAVRDATGYNSEFSKTLKLQLAEALPHGLGLDDVAKFQQVLNHSIRQLVGEMNSDAINTALRKAADIALPDVAKSVKLSELLDVARDNFGKEKHEPFYALWEDHASGGGWLVDMDEGDIEARAEGSYE